eukprot:1159257-Pelagomonas_calceolata.AAC.9
MPEAQSADVGTHLLWQAATPPCQTHILAGRHTIVPDTRPGRQAGKNALPGTHPGRQAGRQKRLARHTSWQAGTPSCQTHVWQAGKNALTETSPPAARC